MFTFFAKKYVKYIHTFNNFINLEHVFTVKLNNSYIVKTTVSHSNVKNPTNVLSMLHT